MPTKYDLDVWRGNTLNRTFRLKTDASTVLDLTGSTFIFRVVSGGAELLRYSSAAAAELDVPTPANGEVVLAMPVAATRLLPDGAVARYELERRIGAEQSTVVYGALNVTGWANDDV